MKTIRKIIFFILICIMVGVGSLFSLLKLNELEVNYHNIQLLMERIQTGKRITSAPNYIYGRAICDGLSFSVDQEQARDVVLHISNHSDKTIVLSEDSFFVLKFENTTQEITNGETIRIVPDGTRDVVLKWKSNQDDEMPIVCVRNIYRLSEDEKLSAPFDSFFPVVICDPSDDYEKSFCPAENMFTYVSGSDFQENGFCSINQDSNSFITAHYYSYHYKNIMPEIQSSTLKTDQAVYTSMSFAEITEHQQEVFYTYYYPECKGALQHFSNGIFEVDLTEKWTREDASQDRSIYQTDARYNLRKAPSVDGELIKTLDVGTVCYGTGQFSDNNDWTQIRLENGEMGWISSKALILQTGISNHSDPAELPEDVDYTAAKREIWAQLYSHPSQNTDDYTQMSMVEKNSVIYNAIAFEDETILNQYTNFGSDSEFLNLWKTMFSSDESLESIRCVYAEYDTSIDGVDFYRTILAYTYPDVVTTYMMVPSVFQGDIFISLFDVDSIYDRPNAMKHLLHLLGLDSGVEEYERLYQDYQEKLEWVNEYNAKVNEYNQRVREWNNYVSGNQAGSSSSGGQTLVCPICNGTGQQYIPNLYYDANMGWTGGYIGCSGCGGSGYIG